jgi:hypothetical protein
VKHYILMDVDHCYECSESRENLGAYTSLEGAQRYAERLHEKRYEEQVKTHHERQVKYWAEQRFDSRGPRPVLQPYEPLKWSNEGTLGSRLEAENYWKTFAIEEWETE